MEAAAEPRQLEFLRRKDRERGFSRFRESSCALTLFALYLPRSLAVISTLVSRESNSPACLRQLRDQKIPAAGRKKEGQREKPKERGREEGKKNVAGEGSKQRSRRRGRQERRRRRRRRSWRRRWRRKRRRGLLTGSRRARSRVARGLLHGLSRCRSRRRSLWPEQTEARTGE